MGIFKMGFSVQLQAKGLYVNIPYGGILNLDAINAFICLC